MSDKYTAFKDYLMVHNQVETLAIANAFYVGYGTGYANSSEDSYSKDESLQRVSELSQIIAQKDEVIKVLRDFVITISKRRWERLSDCGFTQEAIEAQEALEKLRGMEKWQYINVDDKE